LIAGSAAFLPSLFMEAGLLRLCADAVFGMTTYAVFLVIVRDSLVALLAGKVKAFSISRKDR